jgi:hypothetical protein
MKTYKEFIAEAIPAALALGARVATPYVIRAAAPLAARAASAMRTAGSAAGTAATVLAARRTQQGKANQPARQGETRQNTPAMQKPAGKISADERLRRQHAADRRAAAAERRSERVIGAGEAALKEIQQKERDKKYAEVGRQENVKKGRQAATRQRMDAAANRLGL